MVATQEPSRRDGMVLFLGLVLSVAEGPIAAAGGVVGNEDPPGSPPPPPSPADRPGPPRTNMPLLDGPPRPGPFEKRRPPPDRQKPVTHEGGTDGNPGR